MIGAYPIAERRFRAERLFRTALLSLYFLCVLGFLCVPLRRWVNVYDEGLAVLNGARVLGGEVPYRDFWTVYPPGQSYALAAAYSLFGKSLLAARAYDTLVRFLLVVGVYLVGRAIAGRAAALIVAAFSTLWLGTVGFYSYGVFPALALALLATRTSIAFASSGRYRWLVLSGALVGITAIWRLDIALYLGLALALSLLGFTFLRARGEGGGGWPARALRAAAVLAGMAALVTVPVYAWLVAVSGLQPLWQQLVVFPSTVLGSVRRLPYPALVPDVASFLQHPPEYARWARFVLPLGVYAVSLVYLGWSALRARTARQDGQVRTFGIAAVTLFGVLVYAQALSRYDWIHVLPSSIWAALALGAVVSRVPGRQWARWPVALSLSAVLGVVAITYIVPPVHDLDLILKYASPLACHSSLAMASCAVVQPDQERAVAFVRARTDEDEPIFVGNDRHDQILINDVMFYFLADRPCPTPYHELHPGVATTLPVQQAIVEDLQAKQVTWAVTVEWPASTEPNGSAVSSGVHYLDEFIRANYRPTAEYGAYTVWRRH
ncbi:MAG: hypothetical protein ACK2VA_05685 [Anaerolineae bacterium]